MRAGLITILQTLTPESSTVLNHSISEAGRRNHNQTTPLHVAATLLAAPANYLRQACIRSHPNSSHPLQTRALELCFSVALERLPSAQSEPAVTEPPVSNALMAALKRAQAHQRRGCPEQQQQPLLAVKVEIEQLIISILDDPSVSRVMREAGFSSPAVKAMIEQNLNSSGNSSSCSNVSINRNMYLSQRVCRNDENLYLNPRLQQKSMSFGVSSGARSDDVKRVVEIMSKTRKRNPVLVGEFELEFVKREILLGVRNGEFGFKDVEMVSVIPGKVNELIEVIEAKVSSNGRVIVDLGDLKWLVEQASMDGGVDIGREAVGEIGKFVTRCAVENGKVWLIGAASCETFMRCQVYHPSIESDWDLQALPISSRSSFPGRIGPNGMFGSSLESLNSFRNFSTMMSNSPRMPPCCPKCYHDYEQELAKLKEAEKSALEAKSNLPQWLQNAKARSESESETEAKMPHQSQINDQELQKKWIDVCSRIHPNHNQNQNQNQSLMFSRMVTGFVPNRLLSQCQSPTSQQRESPRSPVRTELFLGPQEAREDLPVKDFLGCISSEPQAKGKFVNSADTDSFKKLLKGLMKKAWWQPEAAYTVATTVTQCRSRGTVWLVFAGPDRVGKKKMASVLAEHVCGRDPITVCLGSRHDEDENHDMGTGFRGKTVLDRIVEVVRRNQDSVIVLSDIDEADMLVRGSIKRAMERGRLMDSHGRDISLGNIVFVLTGNWSTNNFDEMLEEKPGELRFKLAVCEKRSKRRADWLLEGTMSAKQQKKVGSALSLDLNLAMDVEEDRTDTSDLTIEQGDENMHFAITSLPQDLVGPNDGVVVFKPVQFGLIRREIEKTVKNAFSTIIDSKLSLEVDETTLDNMLSGIWFGKTSLEDWAAQVLVPSFQKLVEHLPPSVEDMVVRLESDRDLEQVNHDCGWLPSNINVMVDTV
ncbi:clp, P-loop containing nucleoside triphosphate hydrolase [Artemisia annua]|uniref:Clp, P-loop containing nucleoside triphosphate hydrolase n=1 Tax=Artemisia annua TaxID=35608 RepID=A0A2U1MQZ7_ARTAN|nr:clp, P-loop containing nucleoside triphosphate hydrolase [Artemisia annua]